MTETDRLWYAVALAHNFTGRRPNEIDLTRPPALGPHKKGWPQYVAALVELVQKAAWGRGGLKLEYNRFLTRGPK